MVGGTGAAASLSGGDAEEGGLTTFDKRSEGVCSEAPNADTAVFSTAHGALPGVTTRSSGAAFRQVALSIRHNGGIRAYLNRMEVRQGKSQGVRLYKPSLTASSLKLAELPSRRGCSRAGHATSYSFKSRGQARLDKLAQKQSQMIDDLRRENAKLASESLLAHVQLRLANEKLASMNVLPACHYEDKQGRVFCVTASCDPRKDADIAQVADPRVGGKPVDEVNEAIAVRKGAQLGLAAATAAVVVAPPMAAAAVATVVAAGGAAGSTIGRVLSRRRARSVSEAPLGKGKLRGGTSSPLHMDGKSSPRPLSLSAGNASMPESGQNLEVEPTGLANACPELSETAPRRLPRRARTKIKSGIWVSPGVPSELANSVVRVGGVLHQIEPSEMEARGSARSSVSTLADIEVPLQFQDTMSFAPDPEWLQGRGEVRTRSRRVATKMDQELAAAKEDLGEVSGGKPESHVGRRVQIVAGVLGGARATIRYEGCLVGRPPAIMYGLELDEELGTHDGIDGQTRYFLTRPKRACFVHRVNTVVITKDQE